MVDARRCISYLTIEYREAAETIPRDLRSHIGNRIFGCDDCLEVCPYNVQATASSESAFRPSDVTLAPKLDTLAHLTEAEFSRFFRRSSVRRAKHQGFIRNVCIALENFRSSLSARVFRP